MAPISGGQYHWVSEFAPPKYQRFLSYVTGWMSVLSWQAGNASGSFLTGTMIQSLISLNYPDTYDPQPYQGTLLIFSMVLVLYIVNIWGASWWPKIQNGLMVLHIAGFLIVIIVMWVCAPRQSAKNVFTQFTNEGGWSSLGLSIMVGQITAIYALLGTLALVGNCCNSRLLTSKQARMQRLILRKKFEMLAVMCQFRSFGATLETESWLLSFSSHTSSQSEMSTMLSTTHRDTRLSTSSAQPSAWRESTASPA